MYNCALCKLHGCKDGDFERMPNNCPTKNSVCQQEARDNYLEKENHDLAYHSALVESQGYCQKTRVEEIMDFAKRSSFKKLGLAFCIGLRKEAEIFSKILSHNGFEPVSVICKNGSIPKEYIGLNDCEKVRPGTKEMLCNPIAQAKLLNEAKTDFNILLGLCVGHDSLFFKHCDAPVTVLAVKDRVTGHNPLAPLYTSETYYSKKLFG